MRYGYSEEYASRKRRKGTLKMKKQNFKIGPAVIELSGDCGLYDEIAKELMPSKTKGSDSAADLQIKIFNSKKLIDFEGKYYSLSGGISFNDTDIMKKEKLYTYVIKNIFDSSKTSELLIYYDTNKSMLSTAKNSINAFRSNNGCNTQESILRLNIMNYSLMWYVLPLVLMKKEAAFIHSSIMQVNDKGLLMAGTGGCGKTSTSLKLLSEENVKYLSEDFGIIDKDGNAYFNPKNMSIYGSDVRYGQKELVDYVAKKMNKTDRFLWENSLRWGKNPMRKISPIDIFGEEKISAGAKLKDAYFIVRCECNKVSTKEISTEEFVERSMSASFRELKALYEVVKNAEAVSYKDNRLMNFKEIEDKIRGIYMGAFKGTNTMLIYVPLKCTPDEILSAINE